MHFLARDRLFDHEKPYSLRFPPEGDLAQTNIKRERHAVTIRNLREKPRSAFDDCGFEVVQTESKMAYEDFADEGKIRSIYLPEVRAILLQKLGARHVHFLDFAVGMTFCQPFALVFSALTLQTTSGSPTRCIIPDLHR